MSDNNYQPQNVNQKHRQSLKTHDRIAILITGAIGSMYAVYFLMIVLLAWMLWQTTSNQPFDPYPFAFLLFITNVLQLLLMPLIMVGQNIQNRHAELRSEEEFKTTKAILELLTQLK